MAGVSARLAATASRLRGTLTERPGEARSDAVGDLGHYLLAVMATTAAVFAAVHIGLQFAYPHDGASLHGAVTAFWPPVGVGIAALVLYGSRLWPGIAIGGLLAGDYSTPFGLVLGQTLGTVVAALVAAELLVRLGARTPGLRVKDVVVLIVCTAAGTALGASSGVIAIWLAGDLPAIGVERIWRTWWLSDLAGALVVTPALLTWAGARLRLQRRELVEGLALLALLVVLTRVSSQRDVAYVLFPVLIWASLRLGTRGAAAALLAASALTVWDTANGSGPFVRNSLTDSLLSTQGFLAVAALTAMVLAAVTAERAASEAAARVLAHEQAALRRIATLVVTEAEPARVFGQVMEETARALGVATASIVRYEAPGTISIMGGWSETGMLLFPVGTVIEIGDDESSALGEVYRTGVAQRVTYPKDGSRLVADLRSYGYRSSVAAPLRLRAASGARSSPPRSTRKRSPKGRSSGSTTSPTWSHRPS